MRRRQFTLRVLLLLVSACCTLAAAARWFGVGAIALALLVSMLLLILIGAWARVFLRAPEATKYCTVLLIIGAVTFSLLACWMAHARELAHRIHVEYRLRQIGQELAEQEARNFNRLQPRKSNSIEAATLASEWVSLQSNER